MNISVKVLWGQVFSVILGIYFGVESLGHKVTLCLSFWGTANSFPKRLHHFTFPLATYEVPISPCPHPTLVIIFFFFPLFNRTCGIWKLPGQGLNPSCSCDLHHSCSNAISLTHCTTMETLGVFDQSIFMSVVSQVLICILLMTNMLNVFSRAYWPLVYFLWWDIYSNSLLLLKLLSIYCSVVRVLYVFWRQIP